jgi:hypothetical protein
MLLLPNLLVQKKIIKHITNAVGHRQSLKWVVTEGRQIPLWRHC